MSLKTRLQRWWDNLLGRPPWYRDSNVTMSRTDLYDDGAAKKKPAKAVPGELSLVDDQPSSSSRRKQSGGVDPYSNDAGFSKPHGWDRIDRD